MKLTHYDVLKSGSKQAQIVFFHKVKGFLAEAIYREFSPYANFITANLITVVFHSISKIWLMRFYGLFILLLRT